MLQTLQPTSTIVETWLTRKPRPTAVFVASICSLVLTVIAIAAFTDFVGTSQWMPATANRVYRHGEFWRAWTTLFVHADSGHLLGNLFMFFILGFLLNGYFGSMIFPFIAFFMGGVVNLVVLPTYQPETKLIGASGVVYWMGGFWLLMYYLLSRQKNAAQRWLRTLGVAILIFMPAETFEPQVSYRTHLLGFLFGSVCALGHFRLYRDRFRAAEVRAVINDDEDPDDALPPPDGFPTEAHSSPPSASSSSRQ